MRDNGPITHREIPLPDGILIVSKTDPGGRITFVNQAFIETSGFSEQELMGAPHNILRHPHMPPAAFADLWQTIQRGRPWEGLVKNRTKSGDHYWVRANIAPLTEDGKTVGYISIRTKPAAEQVAAAEQLYTALRQGQLPHIRLREGAVIDTRPLARLGRQRGNLQLWAILAQLPLFLAAAGLALWSASPWLCLGLAVLALGLGIGLSRLHLGTTRQSLRQIEEDVAAMARGDLLHELPSDGMTEFSRVNALLRAMKARLAFSIEERVENNRRAETMLRREMLTLTEVLEGEVQDTVGDISTQVSRLSDGAHRLLDVATELNRTAETVAEAVQVTAGNVQTVAAATEELEASSREIQSRIDNTAQLADTACEAVDEASRRVASLSDASARIGNVVTIIQNIAGQTRMLALNATIEAARAGEAGKGFAVVADEVKGLARQTEDGIGDVNAQAGDIGRTTAATVETVGTVTATIRGIAAIAGEVADAAQEQRNATAEIMSSANLAAAHTRDVADNIAFVMKRVGATGEIAHRVNDLSAMVSRDIGALQRRLHVLLRSSYGGDRRHDGRVPVALRFTATISGMACEGFTGDISSHGALLVLSSRQHPEFGEGVIELEQIGRLRLRCLAESTVGMHIRFDDISPHQIRVLEEEIARAKEADQMFIELTKEVAAQAGKALDGALRGGRITAEDLFDINYEAIPDTDPVQVLALHTPVVETLFPALIEPPLSRDPRIVFCCITDRNGYIAVHNAKVSQPQRPGQREWNIANCRNRRIFDDRAGILAARSVKPHLAQTYARDMGGGNFVLLKEVDAPITADGRHWGAVRMGLKLG